MKGYCEICGDEIDVKMCCSGRDCGCMGLPVEPPVCSKEECWIKYDNQHNLCTCELPIIRGYEPYCLKCNKKIK